MTLTKQTWRFFDDAVVCTRLTATNAGPLTGPGTNTYIVQGSDGGPAAIIDPGPLDDAHLDAVIDAAGGATRVAVILVSHTHLDHSAAAPALAAKTGAMTYAFGPHGAGLRPAYGELLGALGDSAGEIGGGEGADHDFKPKRRLSDGQSVSTPNASWSLRAVHTPGHIGNHLSFALENTRGDVSGALFCADHVMGWATSLVSPPDGDMRAYMSSLDKLLKRADRLLLPGHGEFIDSPAERIRELIDHRLGRRAAIEATLKSGPKRPDEIRALVYEGLAPGLHAAAERNVLAHLLELVELKVARAVDPLSAHARFSV